jgi:hypothetical protein
MPTLHLTTAEAATFQSLPASLREGVEVVPETLSFADTEDRRRVRFDLMKLSDPALLALVQKLQASTTEDEIYEAMQGADLNGAADADVLELLFALGPSGLTFMVATALAQAKDDQGILYVAELSNARHELYLSLQNFPS